MPYQDNWLFCKACRGVYHVPDRDTNDFGKCKSGGPHKWGMGAYALFYSKGDTSGGQSNWRHCKKCSILFFNGNVSGGVCPGGGQHDSSASENYIIIHTKYGWQNPSNPWLKNWRWCCKCEQLFLPAWGNDVRPVCPNALVREHDIYCGSGYYDLYPENILWI